MPWNPGPRPAWVERLNALGANLGAGIRAAVPLDAETLLAAATRATDCADFGDEWFRTPLNTLLRSLDDEANLTLLGRLMAATETQRILQNRLRVQDLLHRHPEIESEAIEAPLFVTGLGRSGTTALHELFAQDPANRVPVQWETMYSVPTASAGAHPIGDPRIHAADLEVSLMDEIAPEFPTMHEISGYLPTECIYIFAHQLATDMFLGYYDIPSYAVWLGTTDLQPLYQYHRTFLQVLQWQHRGERWALKAPSHLSHLANVFRTYPDARVVIAHRDPLRVIGSLCNLMATLRAMRSDRVDFDALVAMMSFGFAHMVDRVCEERAAGLYPEDRIIDVAYTDFVADPVATMRQIYDRCGLSLSELVAERMYEYLADKKARHSGAHEYSFAATGLDIATERAKYAEYQRRYNVRSEVE